LVGESDDPLRKPPTTFATLLTVFWSAVTAVVAAACKLLGRARGAASPTVCVIVGPAAGLSGVTIEEAGFVGAVPTGPLSGIIGVAGPSSAGDEGAAGSALLSLGVTTDPEDVGPGVGL
jgi:hypothetical protein